MPPNLLARYFYAWEPTVIPIVFITGIDPVKEGLVASVPRPGGNITGVSFLFSDLHPKRLELLAELLPYARVTALLVNPNLSFGEAVTRDAQDAARAKEMQLQILKAGTEDEIDAAFETLAQLHADALLVGSDPFFESRHQQLVALASRYALPTIYPRRSFADAGGLISYGPNMTAVEHQRPCARGLPGAERPQLAQTYFGLVGRGEGAPRPPTRAPQPAIKRGAVFSANGADLLSSWCPTHPLATFSRGAREAISPERLKTWNFPVGSPASQTIMPFCVVS